LLASPSKLVRKTSDRAPDVAASAIDRELASLRHEINVLKLERAAPAGVSQSSHPGAAPLGSDLRAPSPEEGTKSMEEEDLRQREAAGRYARRLDDVMSQQTRDTRWSRDTEQQIQEVIGTAGVGFALNGVNCAATLCRTVVKLTEKATRQDLARAVSWKKPFSHGTFFTYDGPVATLYSMREDWKPPNMDE
jgi:hypothetical protein